jgi:hypothetical protein
VNNGTPTGDPCAAMQTEKRLACVRRLRILVALVEPIASHRVATPLPPTQTPSPAFTGRVTSAS